MFGGFLEAFLAAGYRADLAGQAQFAEHHQVHRQRAVAQAGDDRCQQCQVGGGFQYLDPADHVDEHVLVIGGYTAMAMQYRQQHGQPVLIQPQGDPPRVAQVAGVDQRLHFHQHRP